MSRSQRRLLFAVLALGITASPSAAEVPTAKDKALLQKVSQRLLAVRGAPADVSWPPEVDFDLQENGIQADATLITKDGKLQSIVRVTPALMAKIVQGDQDRLALILGHEMSHLLLRHVVADPKRDRTPFRKVTFTRAQEFEADRGGVELMVRAGFSFQNGKRAFLRFKDLKLEYTSFEALGLDPPSWDDRLANIDKGQEKIWKAMSAFHNGANFLAAEQYEAAELCFERVIRDFPACHEAWASLGAACLMQYCRTLDAEDLRDYGIGQVLAGGFYQPQPHPGLRRLREQNWWWRGVEGLRQAIRLKPGLTLAKANLGLAYLIHPDGKKHVGEAVKLLLEAADAAALDKTRDPLEHAALLVNLGVAHLTVGEADKGLARFEEAEKNVRPLAGDTALTAALLYNRAQYLGSCKDRESKQKAIALWERYLKTSTPLSRWWPLAYERYVALCKTLGREAKSKDALKKERPEPIRPILEVQLKSGHKITAGEDLEDVIQKIGKGEETGSISRTNLKRLHYAKEGVDLLVTDVVLAICVVGPDAPALSLHGPNIEAKKARGSHLGMTVKEVESLLGYDYQPYTFSVLDANYRFYREQGIAFRLTKDKVTEIIVVPVPKP